MKYRRTSHSTIMIPPPKADKTKDIPPNHPPLQVENPKNPGNSEKIQDQQLSPAATCSIQELHDIQPWIYELAADNNP